MQTPISITDFFSESDLYKRFLHSFAEFEEGQKRPGPKEFDQGLSRLWDMVIRGLELLADKRMDQPLDKIAPLSEGDVTWRKISVLSLVKTRSSRRRGNSEYGNKSIDE